MDRGKPITLDQYLKRPARDISSVGATVPPAVVLHEPGKDHRRKDGRRPRHRSSPGAIKPAQPPLSGATPSVAAKTASRDEA